MAWSSTLKCDGDWLTKSLPGNENELWRLGSQAFFKGEFARLAGLADWATEADFQSPRIGRPYDQAMFGNLATGMARGLAALGEWKQGHSHACLTHLQQSARAYQLAMEPESSASEPSDMAEIALVETANDQAFLRRAIGAIEGLWPIGGRMLSTLASHLIPGLEDQEVGKVRLRVLLDGAIRAGDGSPLLEMRLLADTSSVKSLYPDPVRLGCTVLDAEFLRSLRVAHQVTRDRLLPGARVTWGIGTSVNCRALGGPSAGAAFAAGLIGLADGLEFDTGVAMTAAIDGGGELQTVDSISAKVQFAVRQGIQRFVLSPADAQTHRSKLEADYPGISVVAATHVSQTLPHLTGQAKTVRQFLERIIDQGLLQHIPKRPKHIETGDDLLEFCLPPRVFDWADWLKERSRQKREHGQANRSVTSEEKEYSPSFDVPVHAKNRPSGISPFELTPPEQRKQILVGEPGEGKTTALWLMVAKQAQSLLTQQRAGLPITTAAGFRVPLALPLGLVDQRQSSSSLIVRARDYVIGLVGGMGSEAEPLRDWLKEKISRNEFTLYLDALDELPSGRRGLEWLWKELDALDPTVPILLTTRESSADQAEARMRNPNRLRMLCFDLNHQTYEYIKRFFKHQPDLGNELQQLTHINPGPGSLMQLPLLLELLCEIKQQNPDEELPQTRTKILEKGIYELLRRGEEKRNAEEIHNGRLKQVERVLQTVAWHFHAQEPLPMPEQQLVELLDNQCAKVKKNTPEDGEAFLKELLQDGILVPRGNQSYSFVLRSFHEFCLAGWIAGSARFSKDRKQFQQVVSDEQLAWERPDWNAFEPIQAESWRYVWAMLAGRLEKRASWLLEVLWDPASMSPITHACLSRLKLPYEIAKEIVDPELKERIALEIEEAVFPLIIEQDADSGFEDSESLPAKSLTWADDEWAGIEFKSEFDWIDTRKTLIRHLTDRRESLEVRLQCAKIVGVDTGAASQWSLGIDIGDEFQAILDDPTEPPELRMLCYRYLASVHQLDPTQMPKVWEINYQVHEAWLQPSELDEISKRAGQSIEATRRRLGEIHGETRYELARDWLAADTVSIAVKCEVIEWLGAQINRANPVLSMASEPLSLFPAEADQSDWGLWLIPQSHAEYLDELAQEASLDEYLEAWTGNEEDWAAYNDPNKRRPYGLEPCPFQSPGYQTAILHRLFTDRNENVWLRRLAGFYLSCAYSLADRDFSDYSAWSPSLVHRELESLFEQFAFDHREPWELRCTCLRLLFFRHSYTWEAATEKCARMLAALVLEKVDASSRDACLVQRIAAKTLVESEKAWIDQSALGIEIASPCRLAVAEFGEPLLEKLGAILSQEFELTPLLVANRQWPHLAATDLPEDTEAQPESVLAVNGQQGQQKSDLVHLAQTLGEMGDQVCLDWLRSKLVDRSAPIELRGACVSALGEKGGEADLDLLVQLFEDSLTHEELRFGCATCLAFSSRFSLVRDRMIRMVYDSENTAALRCAYLETLWYSTEPEEFQRELLPLCLELIQDPSTPESMIEQTAFILTTYLDTDGLLFQLAVIDNQDASEELRASLIANLVAYGDVASLGKRLMDREFPLSLRLECGKALNGLLSDQTYREQVEQILTTAKGDPEFPEALMRVLLGS